MPGPLTARLYENPTVICCHSIYSKNILVKLADKLLYKINKDLQQFDFCKPTKLTIQPYEKNYPLHETGRDINFVFIIENKGPGYAYDVQIFIVSHFENISIPEPFHHLGTIEPSSQRFEIPAKVKEREELAFIEVELEWKNFDRSISNKYSEFELKGQRSNLDWEKIELEQPYSLEPIETEDDLVGREKIIKDLIRQSHAKSVGSSYIFGQKRVGKTSIAKALKSQLETDDFLVVYLEGGDYICPDPKDTVEKLGIKLCQQIRDATPYFTHLPIPKFKDGAFSSVIDFLDKIRIADTKLKILFILDEFDELPIGLYRRGPFGDAFFLTMRSISGKPPFGFVLVGGEKMDFIMSCQGDALNKFRSMRVDYFDRENYWYDFHELIRRPVKAWFDINDEAISKLYNQTAGNPFYTKWICSNVFNIMTDRRDSHITPAEGVCASYYAIKCLYNRLVNIFILTICDKRIIFCHIWKQRVSHLQ